MKKFLLTLIGAGALLTASALPNKIPSDLQVSTPGFANQQNTAVKKRIIQTDQISTPVLTRTGENTYEFGYCAGIGNAIGYPDGYVLEAAIMIPPYLAENWVGMEITKILIGFGYSVNKNVNVFITSDLEGEPEYMAEEQMQKEALVFNEEGLGEISQVWNEVEIKTPYKIDGNPFYVGYQVLCVSAPCYPICTDMIVTTDELGDILGAPDGPEGEMVYYNVGQDLGSVCVKFEMQGEMPTEYDAILGNIFLDKDLFAQGEEVSAGFTLLNVGKETITGLDLTCTVGGVEVPDVNVKLYGSNEGGIEFGSLGYVEVEGVPKDVTGVGLPLVITVNGLKGENGTGNFRQRLISQISIASKTYPKKFVVEEFTGTWCVWCPRGLVGMEYMQENYTDKGFIGIGVHANSGASTDPMTVTSYQPMVRVYSQNAFPSAVLNRNQYFDPSINTLEQLYEETKDIEAVAEVSVEAQYSEENEMISATAYATFGDNSSDGKYGFAFVVTQDHVGEFYQQNGFSGGSAGEMAGWEKKARRVLTTYNMVARYIDTAFGIEGSLPGNIEAGKKYEFGRDLSIEEILEQTEDLIPLDINNCYVTALLLDLTTGQVINAAQVSLKGQAGIEGIVAEPADGVYKVYNLQGVKVLETKDASEINTLAKGIYIINGKKIAL